jgi:hypothetical protein
LILKVEKKRWRKQCDRLSTAGEADFISEEKDKKIGGGGALSALSVGRAQSLAPGFRRILNVKRKVFSGMRRRSGGTPPLWRRYFRYLRIITLTPPSPENGRGRKYGVKIIVELVAGDTVAAMWTIILWTKTNIIGD